MVDPEPHGAHDVEAVLLHQVVDSRDRTRRRILDGKYAVGAKPLLNYATQQLTAPGSTFKLVTATAALKEKVIDTQDEVNCQKKATFKKVKNDPNPPKCWIYPGRHRYQNLEGAIANSCNMFFYEMGFRLGLPVDNPEYDEDDYDYDEDDFDKSGYNSVQAVEKIQKYAGMYGLDSVSGVEISESEPQLLTKDPIRGAIGQDTNAYTTASLARYVSAVANSGTSAGSSTAMAPSASWASSILSPARPVPPSRQACRTMPCSSVMPLITCPAPGMRILWASRRNSRSLYVYLMVIPPITPPGWHRM